MAEIEMVMPKMGESIMEATILSWLKQEGEEIESDESVLEVATDKVDTEVPALENGILKKILVKEGEVAKVGQAICIIEIEGESYGTPSTEITSNSVNEVETLTNNLMQGSAHASSAIDQQNILMQSINGSVSQQSLKNDTLDQNFLSPLVRNIIKAEKISDAELKSIQGTGANARITKNDILSFLAKKKTQEKVNTNSSKLEDIPVVAGPGEEIIKMDRMRVVIAERMLESKKISPHVSSFVEADVTDVYDWRAKEKDAFFDKTGEKLSFTPIFAYAVVQTLKEFPMINVSVVGTRIIKKSDINLGIAVALPSGNLIVPVVKKAQHMDLAQLAKSINELVNKARNNKLSPDDLTDGTYTISNIGMFGNIMGTPIIVQPQVAILALGTIEKKPAVIETENGDEIAIRKKMYLSHSYDHRVVDGALGGMFVKKVSDYLEKWVDLMKERMKE